MICALLFIGVLLFLMIFLCTLFLQRTWYAAEDIGQQIMELRKMLDGDRDE